LKPNDLKHDFCSKRDDKIQSAGFDDLYQSMGCVVVWCVVG
jgi:hypothetical protein